MNRTMAVLAALGFLAACSEPDTALKGTRQDLRTAVVGGEPVGISAPAPVVPRPISLPQPRANADWPQRAGAANHSAGHVALGRTLAPLWAVNIGEGEGRRARISAEPVVAGGRIFTLDANATVAATAPNGGALWRTDLTPSSENDADASGGGLAYGEGLVFVTTGFSELVALDPATGKVVWRQKFDTNAGGAPTVSDGHVYVVTRDATAWSVRAADGKVEWITPGTRSSSAVLAASSVAADSRQVILPFSSGQLVAIEKASGGRIWDAYVGGQRLGRAQALYTDVTGEPVIVGDTIYAGTSAGRVSAFRAESGIALWSIPEGATSAVAVVGGTLFFVNDEDQLLRVDAASGDVVWRVDLPFYTKEKPKKWRGIYSHFGPVLAGGRLVLASSDGYLRSFDPVSGGLVAATELPSGAAAGPAVAGGVLYVVTKDGELRAFR